MTVLNVIYSPIAIYDEEKGGDLYCNKKCLDLLFIQTIAIWSISGVMILVMICLIIKASIELKKKEKEFKEVAQVQID